MADSKRSARGLRALDFILVRVDELDDLLDAWLGEFEADRFDAGKLGATDSLVRETPCETDFADAIDGLKAMKFMLGVVESEVIDKFFAGSFPAYFARRHSGSPAL